MKHPLDSYHRTARRIAGIVLLALPIAGNAFPVRGGGSWALTTTGTLVSCDNGAACFPGPGEIPVTTPRTIRFTGQYQGPTIKLDGANGFIFVASRSQGSVTFTTRITDLTTGALLASGVTTTGFIQGTITCAQRGQSPSTNAQPLLLAPVAGAQLLPGSAIEMTISMTSAQPVNLGVCVGTGGSTLTASTFGLGGFIVPEFNPPTPLCGTTPFPDASGTYSFQVVASHPTAASGVSLDVAGMPSGATLTPSLPARGNPVSTRFSWTPPRTQGGRFDVVFTVSDEGSASRTCAIHFDFGAKVPSKQPRESILISPPEFPQKVTMETVCRESVADVCLLRDIVEICVGGKCFGVPQQEPPPCRVCEIERRMRPGR